MLTLLWILGVLNSQITRKLPVGVRVLQVLGDGKALMGLLWWIVLNGCLVCVLSLVTLMVRTEGKDWRSGSAFVLAMDTCKPLISWIYLRRYSAQ